MVSIAGGEPLLHPQIEEIVEGLIARKRFVYLCTNAVLMQRKMDRFKPSSYFSWVVHLDGLKERHDEAVDREGVFDEAVAAIREAKRRGFRVTTNSTFFSNDSPKTVRERARLLERRPEGRRDDDLARLRLREGARPGALPRRRPRRGRCSREAFADGHRKRWRLNHTPLFLDFLEGKVDYDCTPWGIPSYSILGWQRPCYLMADGYTKTYKELLETTDWSQVRPWARRAVRQLHGALRLRADGGAGDDASLRQSLRAAVGTH